MSETVCSPKRLHLLNWREYSMLYQFWWSYSIYMIPLAVPQPAQRYHLDLKLRIFNI
jgi:hypothetical protein